MERIGRRSFLAATSAGLLGSVAGCVGPEAETPTTTTDGPPLDQADRADGGTYGDVYEATIDSVPYVRVFGIDDPTSQQEGRSQGSGFVYEDGYVVTNDHVVSGGDAIDLQYPSGDWAGAEIVGTDFYSDLAVLEVDTQPDAAEPLSFSDELPATGQEVLAIGNPYGLEGSMSRGIVSGVNRSVLPPDRNFAFPNVVQTDAAVNPGNSGGPLVDLDGEVLGVVNAGWGETIGLAISAALAGRVVPSLIEDGSYEHTYMGITNRPVGPLVADANDLSEATGVIVVDVPSDGPAAGVLEGADEFVARHGERIPVGGDVIVGIDDRSIPDRHALSTYLALETDPGDVIAVQIVRDGTRREVELELGARPEPRSAGTAPR